jgi:hypothetical protein
MKKISTVIMIGLLCLSTYSILAPRLRAESEVLQLPAGAYYANHGQTYATILQNINVANQGQIATVAPGQTITIAYTLQIFCNMGPPPLPGEIRQAFFGYSWASSWPPWDAYTEVYDGIPGLYPGVTKSDSFTLQVPTSPGSYNVWFLGESQYSMQDAIAAHTSPPTALPHAIIVVTTTNRPSPVGYWKFDEGSGNIAHDSSGNGNDGTVNGASWTGGISNGALQFDGISNFVGIPSSQSLTVSGNQISLELWMRPSVTLDDSLASRINIMDKGDEYGFQMDAGSGIINFYVVFGSGMQPIATTTRAWTAGSWYQIVGTYDGANENVYVNGVLENTKPLSGNLRAGGYCPLSIGSYCYGTMNFFNGAIDEVKIYNYARTAGEIHSDYASASGLKRILTVNNAGTFGETLYWYLPDGTPFTLMSFLRDKGFLVNLWTDISNGRALSLDILSSYDVVILPSWFFDVQANLQYQNALLDYVNQGGGLLFAGQSGFAQTLDGSLGFKYVDGGFVDASIVDSSHPIMQGISELPKAGGVFVDWDNVITETPLPSNVAILARTTDPSNRIALIAFQHGNGRVVAGPSDGLLRPYEPTDVDSWSPTSQTVIENKLLINAINWVASATQPDFEISVSKEYEVADPHSTTEFVVTVESFYGFNQPVTLSAVFSSHELSGTFANTVVTPPANDIVTTTLTVSALSEEIITHQIYITGTSGSLSHTDTVSLHVPYMSVSYLSQGDTGWCLPTSLAMAMGFYGKSLRPWDVATWFGLGHDQGPAWAIALPEIHAYLVLHGLGWTQMIAVSANDLKTLLSNGPVILPLRPTQQYSQGHVIVLTGYLNDGFYVNNPASGMQELYSWTDLSPLILDTQAIGVSNTICITGGTPVVSKGFLNLVGGKDSLCRSIQVDHEDWQTLLCSPGPYVWENGYGGLPLDWGVTWQYGSHQHCLDPCDKMRIAYHLGRDSYGLIVNPTSKRMQYEFQMVFDGPSLSFTRYVYVDADPCEVVNPGFGSIDLGEALGNHYGKYTITLKLLDNAGALLDQIVLPEIKYLPVAKMSVRSPANLFVTDPLGRSIGTDPKTGAIVQQIPDAFYSGPGTEPQVVIIPDPISDTYSIALVGTATGDYTLTIEYVTSEKKVTQAFSGTISEQEQQYYSALISETGEMTAISWEYVFKDGRRGTMLKISTDDKYFQFIAPSKDFGVKYDPNMKVLNNYIAICYQDNQMCLVAAAVHKYIDSCVATAYDKQTRKFYLLIDQPTRR